MKDRNLEISYDDQEIVIRIGAESIAVATEFCENPGFTTDEGEAAFTVVDIDQWCKSVIKALTDEEEEDGTTLVHKMFDAAFDFAVNQGYEGIEEVTE